MKFKFRIGDKIKVKGLEGIVIDRENIANLENYKVEVTINGMKFPSWWGVEELEKATLIKVD